MAAAVHGEPKRNGDWSIRTSGGVPIIDETYTYLVVADTVNESYANVYNATGLPQTNRTVSPSGYGYCRSKRGTRSEINPKWWDVVCSFSTEVEEGQNLTEDDEAPTDPTAWIPVYETKFERMQEIVTKDRSGNAIANSAGQAFDNGMQLTRLIPIWTFYQFEPDTISDEDIIARNEVINSAEFRGRDPYTLLLSINSSVIGFFYGQRCRFTSYSIRYNKKNWKHKRLDVGTAYLDTGVLKANVVNGHLMRCGLNGSGAKVSDGTDPSILEFDQFEELDFNTFLRTT